MCGFACSWWNKCMYMLVLLNRSLSVLTFERWASYCVHILAIPWQYRVIMLLTLILCTSFHEYKHTQCLEGWILVCFTSVSPSLQYQHLSWAWRYKAKSGFWFIIESRHFIFQASRLRPYSRNFGEMAREIFTSIELLSAGLISCIPGFRALSSSHLVFRVS